MKDNPNKKQDPSESGHSGQSGQQQRNPNDQSQKRTPQGETDVNRNSESQEQNEKRRA